MKKLVLIPTLLTVVSTPLVSLVGCGKNQFKLTHTYTADYGHTFLRTEERVDLKAGVNYTAIINMADFDIPNGPAIDLEFWVCNEDIETEDSLYGLISTASVTVDDKQLEQVDKQIDLTSDKFWIDNTFSDYSCLLIGNDSTTPTSIVKIIFSLKEDVTQYYLISEYFPI